MKRTQILLGIIAFTLGILSAVSAARAAESPEIDPNSRAIDGASINLPPFRTNQNLTLAVESPDEAAEADQLAKQLANPIASLISVPFQANEDWGFLALPATATSSRLTFSPSFQSRSPRIGT